MPQSSSPASTATDNVDEGHDAAVELPGKHGHAAQALLDVGDAAAREVLLGHAGPLEHRRCHRIALRVHRRGVQRVLAPVDAEEAGALLVGLGTEL